MNLYLAAVYTSNFGLQSSACDRLTESELARRKEKSCLLESYHYIHRQKFVDYIRADKEQVFLDSGAFSAYTKGVDVDIDAYCDYIKRNDDIIKKEDGILCASVLDGIGDPLKTYENQCYMESKGAKPLPCFHYGEDERYLEYYVANYDYITLGGMVPISTPQLRIWLDRLWDRYLTDGSGRPRLRVHGFGLTNIPLMERYPWFSVDSSSWVQLAAFGNIYLPGFGMLAMSNNSPVRHDYNKHYDTMPKATQDYARERIEAYGFTVDRLRETYEPRWTFNYFSYNELGRIITKSRKAVQFTTKQMELF